MDTPRGITIATICARGASKGLPGKNIRPFPTPDGPPLIAHTIAQALACARIDKVCVSTDDPQIAAVAREAGAIVPFLRPASMATDTASKLPAIEHLVAHMESLGDTVAVVVDLQPTSPLRETSDIVRCIDALDDRCDLVLSVYDSPVHPAFTLVEMDADGRVGLCAPAISARRQDLPPVFALNGSIYCWSRHALPQAVAQGLWSVRVKGVSMPRERSADIDDLLDFEWAAWLAQRAADATPARAGA